jgi:hypothetical protein
MGKRKDPIQLLREADTSLLDLVDHILNKGVLLTGDVVLSIADVDLVYLRLSLLLCAADKMLPDARPPPRTKRRR